MTRIHCALALAALCLTGGAWAIEEKSSREQALDTLSAQKPARTAPAWNDLSDAQPVDLAPPNAEARDTYPQAYQLPNGCRFFWVASADRMDTLKAAWSGGRCNGGLIAGQGELRLMWREKHSRYQYLQLYSSTKGSFKDGYISGESLKHNYAFRPGGERDDEYIFTGTFGYGVLNGKGSVTRLPPVGTMPSAIVTTGYFKAAVPHGLVLIARLNPRSGVDRDAGVLVVNDKGQTYRFQEYQKTELGGNPEARDMVMLDGNDDVTWVSYFSGTRTAWVYKVQSWDGDRFDGKPAGGILGRNLVRNGLQISMAGTCDAWQEQGNIAHCEKGTAVYSAQPDAENRTFIGTQKDTAFDLALDTDPSTGQAVRFNPKQDILVYAGPAKLAEQVDFRSNYRGDIFTPMRCSKDMSRCTGKHWIGIGTTGMYWYGQATVLDGRTQFPLGAGSIKQGEIKNESLPFSGVVMANYVIIQPDEDEDTGTCVSLDDNGVCGNPIIISGDVTASGGRLTYPSLLTGKALSSVTATREARRAKPQLRREGSWQVTFSDGRVANVRFDPDTSDLKILDVDRCEDPDDRSVRYTCRLNSQGGVVFVQH